MTQAKFCSVKVSYNYVPTRHGHRTAKQSLEILGEGYENKVRLTPKLVYTQLYIISIFFVCFWLPDSNIAIWFLSLHFKPFIWICSTLQFEETVNAQFGS